MLAVSIYILALYVLHYLITFSDNNIPQLEATKVVDSGLNDAFISKWP